MDLREREKIKSRIEELEEIIERGLKSFVEVGLALTEIREGRLYKQLGYKSFESYCVDRWKIKRAYANKQILASKVVSNLKQATIVAKNLPTAESQIRPLVNLEPEQQCTIWRKSVEVANGVPTAKVVKEVKKKLMKEIEPTPTIDESLPILEVGDICIIQAKEDKELKAYQGFWGVIRVSRDSSYDVEMYDRTLELIKPEYLQKVDCSELEKQQAIDLMSRLQKIATVETVSRSINAILLEFGSRRDFTLPEIDKNILTFIENQLGIKNN